MTPLVVAHGLVGRADLPLPVSAFAGAAAVVLAVSFAALAAGWTRPRFEAGEDGDATARREPPLALQVAGGVVGVALFVLGVYAGLTGTDVPTQNLLPTLVFVVMWVAVPMVSLLAGDVFRHVNPWRAIGRLTGWAAARTGADTEPLAYPERLGRWPAAIGIVLFAAVELCWGKGNDPQTLAILAILYSLVQFAGMGLYGVETWSRNGDAFGVYFSLFARLSPFGPGPTRLDAGAGTVAVLVAAIGATTFDGAKEGNVLGEVLPDLQDGFGGLGFSKGTSLELAFLVGLLVTLAFVAAIYLIGARRLARPLAHSLIPIAAAYVVAHYFSLAVFQLQAVPSLLADPTGSDPGGADVDYGIVSATAIWWVQVAALVAGHVGALVLAHDRALALHERPRDATRSQLAMLAVMIAFTCVGLFQLSAANS